jgi:hypothetical protein
MWAGLRGTPPVSKWIELREALRAGLGVRFLFSLASWREVLFFPWREIYSGTSNR